MRHLSRGGSAHILPAAPTGRNTDGPLVLREMRRGAGEVSDANHFVGRAAGWENGRMAEWEDGRMVGW